MGEIINLDERLQRKMFKAIEAAAHSAGIPVDEMIDRALRALEKHAPPSDPVAADAGVA